MMSAEPMEPTKDAGTSDITTFVIGRSGTIVNWLEYRTKNNNKDNGTKLSGGGVICCARCEHDQ